MRPLILLVMMSAAAAAQDVPANNRAAGRGMTPTERPSQSMDRGRAGSEAAVPDRPVTWRGILVDAGCQDRSITNLRKPPALSPAVPPDKPSADAADSPNGPAARDAAVSSHGINVDARTAEAERSGPLETHTADHLTRQMDPSCAITADTRGFALLLANGTLLNLDEGGNTKAFQMFQANPAGRAIINGNSTGEKPRAVIKGIRRGDKLTVVKIRRFQ
jgi:hypothetical protein